MPATDCCCRARRCRQSDRALVSIAFILPDIFQDLQTFQTWFDFDEQLHADGGSSQIIEDENKHKTISKLHTILDPFLLRRLKTDVLKFLPPKREYMVCTHDGEANVVQYRDPSKTLEERSSPTATMSSARRAGNGSAG